MRGSIKILLTIDLWLGTSEIKRTFSNKSVASCLHLVMIWFKLDESFGN